MQNKFIDSTKLQFHPIRVAQILQADTWQKAKEVYPIYAEISPLNFCNHDCSFCAIDYIRSHDAKLDLNLFRTRIAEMGELGLKSLMFAGEGEPLLHKDIVQMVVATRAANIDVAFTTNAVPMMPKFVQQAMPYVNWIKVSFNAGTPEGYSKIHRTNKRDFHTVVENIKYAVQYKREKGLSCEIGMQLVLLDENVHEAEEFVKLAKSLGVDYAVVKKYSQHKFSITHQHEGIDYSKYLNLGEVLEGYSDENFSVTFRNNSMVEQEPYKKCMSTPNVWAYIDSNMNVYSCSAFLGQEKFNLGNLNTQTFKEIWQGPKRQANYEMMKTFDLTNCRDNCRMSNCNAYLDQVANDLVPNVNFI